MIKRFYSHGKLLITGEYLVLNGAKALAVPLKRGQNTEIELVTGKNEIHWESFYEKSCWFNASYNSETLTANHFSDSVRCDYIIELLMAARKLNPQFLLEGNSVSVKNNLEFSPDWGFGGSSTIISNIAYWANVDPYKLNNLVSNGSGYDIACARSETPVIFQKKNDNQLIRSVKFDPPFSENLFLIWLGNKENTQQNINRYLKSKKPSDSNIGTISGISEEISETKDLKNFQKLLNEHNYLMSKVLNVGNVNERFFHDFEGIIKPLGAWGGDFILAVSESEPEYVRSYFIKKGLNIFFNWDELMITEK